MLFGGIGRGPIRRLSGLSKRRHTLCGLIVAGPALRQASLEPPRLNPSFSERPSTTKLPAWFSGVHHTSYHDPVPFTFPLPPSTYSLIIFGFAAPLFDFWTSNTSAAATLCCLGSPRDPIHGKFKSHKAALRWHPTYLDPSPKISTAHSFLNLFR